LHLAFHALGEFPDRPYQQCTEKQLANDYDLTMKELVRIAGDKSCTPPTNVHWAMLAPQNFHVLKERGLKILTSSGFMSNRIIVDGEIQQLKNTSCDIGFFYEQDGRKVRGVIYALEDRKCGNQKPNCHVPDGRNLAVRLVRAYGLPFRQRSGKTLPRKSQ
jgi:hypothetical protein